MKSTAKKIFSGTIALAILFSAALLIPGANAQNTENTKKSYQTEKPRLSEDQRPKLQAKMAELREKIDHQIEPLENGVVITVTTTDPELVAKIQNRPFKGPKFTTSQTEIAKENLENGVRITVTSDDSELVAKMHERLEKRTLKEEINREVKLLENGAEVILTSDNPQTVAMIQDFEGPQNKPLLEKLEINVLKVNLENGVKLTITTDNERLIEKIQTKELNGGSRIKPTKRQLGR
jgi:TusA-related sulfurtransferase